MIEGTGRRRGAPAPERLRVTVDGIAWPVQGAQVAIVEHGRVLVQFRPWPPGWELPGGHCDPDELPSTTAGREAAEETGFDVRILGLVGVYSWTGLRRAADAVYLGEITGGRRRWNIESWAVQRVSPDQPPRALFPWCRQRLQDAVAVAAGAPPVHRFQRIGVRQVLTFGTAWVRVPVDAWRRRRFP